MSFALSFDLTMDYDSSGSNGSNHSPNDLTYILDPKPIYTVWKSFCENIFSTFLKGYYLYSSKKVIWQQIECPQHVIGNNEVTLYDLTHHSIFLVVAYNPDKRHYRFPINESENYRRQINDKINTLINEIERKLNITIDECDITSSDDYEFEIELVLRN
jgi:hypothetical protein